MNRVLKELFSLAIYLLVVLGCCYLLITYVVQRTVVNGTSMETTLQENDNLLVDKLSYRFKEPERFDIVVFPYKYELDTHYIKRIIGLPGERVRIDEEGKIYINDKELVESYGMEIIKESMRGRAVENVVLGENEYFVMGDNRNNSYDSRFERVGNINKEDIIGKAWVRIWPFDKIGVIND